MVSSGISDVEKIRLKKCMVIMIIVIMFMNEEMTVFSGCQKLPSAMKLRPEK